MKVYHDPKLGEATPEHEDVKKVNKATLFGLIGHFERLSTSVNDKTNDSIRNEADDTELILAPLLQQLEAIAEHRCDQKHPSLLTSRVLAMGNLTEELIKYASECAKDLEITFRAQSLRSLIEEERVQLKDSNMLLVLEKPAEDIDIWSRPSTLSRSGVDAPPKSGIAMIGNGYGGRSFFY